MSVQTAPTYYFSGINFNNNFYKTTTTTVSNAFDSTAVYKAGTQNIAGNKTDGSGVNIFGATVLNNVPRITYNVGDVLTQTSALGNTLYYWASATAGASGTVNNTNGVIAVPMGIWLVHYSQMISATTAGSITVNRFGMTTDALATLTNCIQKYSFTTTYAIGTTTCYGKSCVLRLSVPTNYSMSSVLTYSSGAYNLTETISFTRIG